MLVYFDKKFVKAPFDNELELETVVVKNYEYLFGPSSFYLPKALIKTADGVGTIPDGFAIDILQKQWYIVEAELAHHSVWSYISPQVIKQILASQQPISKQSLEDLAVKFYERDESIREKFLELNIPAIHVRKVIRDILEKEPIIGLPIDSISEDLKAWARTLKYKVKLWIISKFVEINYPKNIVYEFPEEFRPELDTELENKLDSLEGQITRYDVRLSDLIEKGILAINEPLFMQYKPKNGQQQKYEATVLEDGSLYLLNQNFSSPSYAALAGIQDAGSSRQTVNGWAVWKNAEGKTLAELREKFLQLETAELGVEPSIN